MLKNAIREEWLLVDPQLGENGVEVFFEMKQVFGNSTRSRRMVTAESGVSYLIGLNGNGAGRND